VASESKRKTNMPGIAGVLVKKTTGTEESTTKLMVDCMLHESFYRCATFSYPDFGFFVGYAVAEGAYADCMPIYNEKQDVVLFLTGECYPTQ
jgi:hypothetical protein